MIELDTNMDEFPISKHTYKCLNDININTVRDLLLAFADDLGPSKIGKLLKRHGKGIKPKGNIGLGIRSCNEIIEVIVESIRGGIIA